MKYQVNYNQYEWLFELFVKYEEEIMEVMNKKFYNRYDHDGTYSHNWTLVDVFGDGEEDDINIFGQAVEEVFNKHDIEVEFDNGVQTVAFFFSDEDKVFKMTGKDGIEELNSFYNALPKKYAKFFLPCNEAGCIKVFDEEWGDNYIIAVYVQDRADTNKCGASNNKYYSLYDTCAFRSPQLMASIGEELAGCTDSNIVEEEIEVFDYVIGKVFDELRQEWWGGDLDIHDGNWGCIDGKPRIFDPIYA